VSKSQRELKAVRQAQRDEALRRQRTRERRNLLLIVGGLAAAGLAILVVALYLNNAAQKTGRLAWQTQTGVAGEQVPDEAKATHIPATETWQYKNYPPTSGPHYGSPDGPVAWQTIATMREGHYIHNLEHGGIVILYNCPSGQECDKLKSDLSNYVETRAPIEPIYKEVKLVMSPYSRDMKKKVALLAWNWIEFLDGYDEKEITRFYEIHVNNGPEKVP
jgi:hypothetical protein